MTTDLIRVKHIKVISLFGLYNHSVDLKPDRVTIIHGPNGVGKTVFLRLINAFLLGRYAEFVRVTFESFEIAFSDGGVVQLSQLQNEKKTARSLKVAITTSGGVEKVNLDGDILNVSKMAAQISADYPYIAQVGPDEWIDRRTDEVIDASEVLLRYAEENSQTLKNIVAKEPKSLKALRMRVKAHFIEAQRLIRVSRSSEWRYRSPEKMMMATVQEYSIDLKKKLESTLANYAKQSQKLDQTFPQRLIENANAPLPLDILKKEMEDIEASRTRLKNIGLLDSGDGGGTPYPLEIAKLDKLQATQVSVISVYAGDTKEKLAVLSDLAQRIELLLKIISKKFTNKRLTISREVGLVVLGLKGEPIPITALSSGEQHEIVLLYDLLFKVKPNTLVLIDEPELSLHVSWQKGFLDDILEIIRVAQFDVLMATHSPYIVGDRSDLMVVLASDVKE